MFERFPYTDFHDLNLDWILDIVKEVTETVGGYDNVLADIEERLRKDERWIDEFDTVLVRKLVNEYLRQAVQVGVYFELTDSGYFKAVYPDTWESVRFGTDSEGHLVLHY